MLLRSKIHPDNLKPSQKNIYRASAVEALRQNLDKNIIIVKAQVGYGKTSLISELIDYTRIPFAYFRIDSDDDNLYRFLSYLFTSIGDSHEQFGSESQNYLDTFKDEFSSNRADKDLKRSLLSMFVNELYEIDKDFFVVLDDFHFLAKDSPVTDFLKDVFDNSASCVRFIILTKEDVRFSTVNLLSKRKIYELPINLLSFNTNEIIDLSVNLYKKNLSYDEADLIRKLTEGWITGIHLFLQADTDLHLQKGDIPGDIYNFFTEEIYSHLPESSREFLMFTSIPGSFTKELADFLFAGSDISETIEFLLAKNVFLRKFEESKGVKYIYSDLFGNFLRNKFESSKTGEEKRKFYFRLGKFYQKNKNILSAIDFYLLSENYTVSIDLIIKNIKLFLSEDISVLFNWFQKIPGNIKNDNKELVYYEAMIWLRYDLNYEKALELFDSSLNNFPPVDELDIKTVAFTGEIHIRNLDYKRAETLLKKEIKKRKHSLNSFLLFNLSKIYLATGDYNKCEKVLVEALEVIENCKKDFNMPDLKYEIMNVLGGVYMIKGNYTKALYYYKLAVNNISSQYKRFQIYQNVLHANMYCANFKEAFEIYDKIKEFEKLKELPELKSNILLSLAILYYELGDYISSIKYSEILNEHALRFKIKEAEFFSLLHIANNLFYLKDETGSKKYLDLAEKASDPVNDANKVELKLISALLLKSSGDLNRSEDELNEVLKFFEKNDMEKDSTYTLFHLADLYYKKNDKERSKHFLELSLKRSAENNYIGFLRNELLYSSGIFDFAVKNKIRKNYIAQVYAEAFSNENIEFFSNEGLEFHNSNVEQLFRIRLYLLGREDIFVDNKEIDNKVWKRKNFKLAFFYIILNRNDHLSKDFLIEKFLDDVPFEHLDNVYHQLVSACRSVLNSGSDKEDILINRNKILSLNENYYYYSDVEEFLDNYKKLANSSPLQKPLLNKTLALYKGSFLKDNFDEWVEDVRVEIDNKYERLLNMALVMAKNEKSLKDIINYTELWMKFDNLAENAYLENIRANILDNNKNAARSKSEIMRSTFKKVLGELPSQKTLKEIDLLLK